VDDPRVQAYIEAGRARARSVGCPSGTTPFDPARLARIQASLERQGVTFVVGADGEALARSLGAEAIYWPEVGRPGFIALGPGASCAAVIEELIHLGQHRRARWGDVQGRIAELELEAQGRLRQLGMWWDWSDDDLMRLLRASRYWRGRYYEREASY
jgi:hypothetical protein